MELLNTLYVNIKSFALTIAVIGKELLRSEYGKNTFYHTVFFCLGSGIRRQGII